jgi:hypothetical protein
MIRLHIVTEGATEEMFVNDVLRRYLAPREIFADAHSVTTRRDRKRNKKYRGGLINLEHLFRDIDLWLKQESLNNECWVTTMVDLYAFPYNHDSSWEDGYSKCNNGLTKALFLEEKLQNQFANYTRFIPYVQLHEFEALLLSDTSVIHNAFSRGTENQLLTSLNDDIKGLNPEDINTGRETCPSKRIIKYYEEYDDDKPTYGTLIANDIGIDNIRSKCPHFNEWISKIEKLVE